MVSSSPDSKGIDAVTVCVDGIGIGYEILLPASDFRPTSESCVYWVHAHFSERSGYTFYGFPLAKDRSLFRVLIRAHGIGAKTAYLLWAILGENLIPSILSQDLTALSSVPGIGKKSASKLVLSLREVMAQFAKDAGIAIDQCCEGDLPAEVVNEAVMVLAALGYGEPEIKGAIKRLSDAGGIEKDLSTENFVKLAISEMTCV